MYVYLERTDRAVDIDSGADEVDDAVRIEVRELEVNAETKLLVNRDGLVKLVVVVLDVFSGDLVLATMAEIELEVVVALLIVLLNPKLTVGVAILIELERLVLLTRP